MSRKLGFGLLGVSVAVYAFFLAPPIQPDTFELIKNLSTGNWDGINPVVIALFNIMGIWPMIYSGLIFSDGREQKIAAWPFVIVSFAVGAFALLPYLALREPNQKFTASKDIVLKILDSHWLGFALTLGTLVLLSFGLLKGDWADFIQQWQSSRFIHVMSLDFCLFCLLFPALLGDDMARRGMQNSSLFWAVALVPLVGSILYLCLRPPLLESGQEAISSAQ